MPNLFRTTYRELTDAEKRHIAQIKTAAQALLDAINAAETTVDTDDMFTEDGNHIGAVSCFNNSRDRLQESVFWATYAITN